MATVDLDKLSAELTAAGLWVVSRKECGGTDLEIYRGRGKSHSIVITISDSWDGVFVESDGENSISPEVWTIIARHVAPVAPDPGLREAIAKAEWEAVWAVMVRDYRAEPMTWDEASDQAKDDARAVADAVLAVLAERGVR